MFTDMQELIADDMSHMARIKAAIYMVRDLPTEDIELVNKAFPKLAETALYEILNPHVNSEAAVCNDSTEVSYAENQVPRFQVSRRNSKADSRPRL
jgi:hypothetical protein